MCEKRGLNGKRFLITGGTRGIGRAISLRFAREGASVLAVFVRDQGSADELMRQAQKEGLNLKVLRADLTHAKGQAKVLSSVGEGKGGQISGLVYSSATGIHKPLDELTSRHFDWIFNLNVRAFFDLVTRLRDRFTNPSSIVVLSSEGAIRAVPLYTLVGSSKGALDSMARHLAVEMAPRGVRVNILAPGAVLTDAWNILPDRDRRIEMERARCPMGRLVTPEQVAEAALFLCSDAASGINGHRLVVDGGAGIVQ